MTNNSITDEICTIRRALSAQFGNDVSKILADARQREAADGHTYVTLPKRHVAASDSGTTTRRGPFNG
jgi:hypothetical protein